MGIISLIPLKVISIGGAAPLHRPIVRLVDEDCGAATFNIRGIAKSLPRVKHVDVDWVKSSLHFPALRIAIRQNMNMRNHLTTCTTINLECHLPPPHALPILGYYWTA